MRGPRQQSVRQARSVLFWSVLCFLVSQVTAGVLLEHRLSDSRDPEFALKLHGLEGRLRKAPHNPLVLMLGSSRTSLGFCARQVRATWNESPAVIFNFGLSGGGPLVELLTMRRLLARGIHPDLVLLEVLPAMLNQAGSHPLEEVWLQGSRLRMSEIKQLQPYATDRTRLVRRWWKSRLLPWPYLQRSVQEVLLRESLPLPLGAGGGRVDSDGWEPHFLAGITPEERRKYLQIAQDQYGDSMGEFHPAEQPVQALHAVLDLCRQQGIPVVLVLMPEGKHFQALYPPALRAGLDAFITNLSRQRGLPLIDARNWLEEQDLFDSHHALPSGAAIFTERLAREVIVPLLRRKVTR